MRRPWIGLIVIVLLVAGAVSAAWYWGDGDWGPRDHTHTEIARVVNADGTTPANGDIVVVETNRGGPFFPFFFPFGFFFFFGIIFLISRLFFWGRRGPHGYSAGPQGAPPAWFDEWHRRAHEHDWESSPRRQEQTQSENPDADPS